MAFSWHKLIPTGRACPEVITCIRTLFQSGTICWDPCPGGGTPIPGGGTLGCQLDPACAEVQGTGCPEFSMVNQTPTLVWTPCPREIRLSGGTFPCEVTNNRSNVVTDTSHSDGIVASTPADPGTWNAQFGYYRTTPRTPTSTPNRYDFTPVCIRWDSFSIPDRMLVISGRNRYRYAGWGVDPVYGNTGGYTGMPEFWHNTGGTGLSQSECSIPGRGWPLPNSIMNLPLWGANTSNNPNLATSIDECGNVIPCSDPECFGCRENSGLGHFVTGPNDVSTTNGKYYFSHQCFNPQAYYRDSGDTNSVRRLYHVPPCSVWSFVRAIYDRELRLRITANQLFGDPSYNETNFRNDYPNLTSVVTNMFNSDPSLTGVGNGATAGQSMVRIQLDRLKTALSTDLYIEDFYPPNVFLWDRTAYLAASTADKWKHLYIIGNGNVLHDTDCVGSQGQRGFATVLDEVCHDPIDGSSGNARLIQFFGCDPTQSSTSNRGSQTTFSVSMMACLPVIGETQTTNYCQACTDQGGIVGDCAYNGMKICP